MVFTSRFKPQNLKPIISPHITEIPQNLPDIAPPIAGIPQTLTSLNKSSKNKYYSKDYLNNYLNNNNDISQDVKNWWGGLTDQQRKAYVDNYTEDSWWEWFGEPFYTDLDVDGLLSELAQLSTYDTNMPEMPTYLDSYNNLDSYKPYADYITDLDKLETSQTNVLNDQLAANNAMFDNYRSQILGQQYQQNTQALDAYRSSMDYARRNALEAGASAGLRMAENINTTLALQNKQSQISLETSNQLAQQLLNQRQAAMGLRSDYSSLQNNMFNNRTSARDTYARQSHDENMATYDKNLKNWENSFNRNSNPMSEAYRDYLINNKPKSNSVYNNSNTTK